MERQSKARKKTSYVLQKRNPHNSSKLNVTRHRTVLRQHDLRTGLGARNS